MACSDQCIQLCNFSPTIIRPLTTPGHNTDHWITAQMAKKK